MLGVGFPTYNVAVNDVSPNEVRKTTGFSLNQLHALLLHLLTLEQVCGEYSERYYIGEEAFLHYLVYNRLEVMKLQLLLYYWFRLFYSCYWVSFVHHILSQYFG